MIVYSLPNFTHNFTIKMIVYSLIMFFHNSAAPIAEKIDPGCNARTIGAPYRHWSVLKKAVVMTMF
jgi:hypothetical protein